MKKAILALVAVAALCLTGCGKNYVEEYLGDYECTMTATINTNELGPVSQSLSSDFTIKEGTNDGEVVLEFTDIDLILRGTVDKEGLHIEQSNLKFKYNIADVDVVMNKCDAVLKDKKLVWATTGTGKVIAGSATFEGDGNVAFDATKK